jgi:hypothetical protein
MLDKVLKGMMEPRAAKIETTQDLRTKCLNQPYCAVLLKGSKTVDSATKKAIQKLLVEQPKMVYASIDTSVLYMKNMEEFLPELTKGRHRFVVFKKISGSLDPKDTRLISSYAAMDSSGVSYGQMSNLIAGVMSGSTAMTKMSALPMVKTRTKKIEAEDKAKRERKSDQKQRSEDKANGVPPSSSPTANDGTKEGRRAERDRRRQEHRESSGGRERTPEEIAEIERQRRIRMQEAENSWTIQDGDLPPEGEPVGDDSDDYMDDGDYDDDDDGDDDDGENDDDVMDLD